ncbi:unnamed protein product [Linum tenue]|uniref:Uncharacterized protein n=1 Tax=Linum tenue TaxID=586396 RepID=A0AAV0QD50_9ROSI|nr:unnamed protein product [Linum tenue]
MMTTEAKRGDEEMIADLDLDGVKGTKTEIEFLLDFRWVCFLFVSNMDSVKWEASYRSSRSIKRSICGVWNGTLKIKNTTQIGPFNDLFLEPVIEVWKTKRLLFILK